MLLTKLVPLPNVFADVTLGGVKSVPDGEEHAAAHQHGGLPRGLGAQDFGRVAAGVEEGGAEVLGNVLAGGRLVVPSAVGQQPTNASRKVKKIARFQGSTLNLK